MDNCLFCNIVKGDIPSSTIYEDELIKVFLDINPNTNGDLLIIPKKHYENILDIEEEIITHSYSITKNIIYKKLVDKLNATGLTISQNNGTGQEIKHFHIHLTPRYENDEFNITSNKEILLDLKEIENKLNS